MSKILSKTFKMSKRVSIKTKLKLIDLLVPCNLEAEIVPPPLLNVRTLYLHLFQEISRSILMLQLPVLGSYRVCDFA